ncbi:MAG TPA: peptidylprolyl isomerase [Candidatus Acidoferrum sp.]|jgi:peptidyl-prolyl cis-trans isomerase B (cyclophilin B)|nr:peptidylprolyl isomerase [Candidatus Acidoferrum sp.]
MKSIYLACALSLVVGITTAFADGTNTAASTAPAADNSDVAVIKTTDGTIVVAFWPKEAPNTVANFEKLSRQGFYDGTLFHRIIKGFMVQGGDPLTKDASQEAAWGTGGPGYSVNAEFNDHSHQYGVLSMARSSDPNSAGSQFFICDGDAHFLDHQYTAFGHLIKGGDVLDKIANTPCGPNGQGENSKPLQRVGIVSIKIVPADSIK